MRLASALIALVALAEGAPSEALPTQPLLTKGVPTRTESRAVRVDAPGQREAVRRLQAPLRETRRPGWSRDQLELESWSADLDGQEQGLAEILATGRIPAWGDEPQQTLSEVQLELLLDACCLRPGLGRRIRAVAPAEPTAQGAFQLQVVAADLRGAVAALGQVAGGDDGRWARGGLARLLRQDADEEQRTTLLLALRSLQGAPKRWLLEALADRGSAFDGDLLAQVAAEGSVPPEALIPSLQRCQRGHDLAHRRAAVVALESLAAAADARTLELALVGLARLRAGEVEAARALESRDARVRAAGERWCRAVGAPPTPSGLESWLRAEQEWLDRIGEVRDLLRSPEPTRQLAGLGVVATRTWNQEVWGTLVAGHLRPADPRVARRQLEVLLRLDAAARIEVALGILQSGPAALAPLAITALEQAGLGTSSLEPSERS
ncbi:MAG: hypothetical protein O2799_03130 [Planctomycetota bacterium]|nr:hypothetical protein [Planctomycetota bacterium]